MKKKPVISARKWAEYFSSLFNQEESDTITNDFTEHVNNVLEQHWEVVICVLAILMRFLIMKSQKKKFRKLSKD